MGFLYTSVTTGLDEPERLRVDALLELEGAAQAYATHKAETVSTAGFEVG